ncbi:hypothetical protein MMC18_005280 [Xylographa bjoerkii]|nr:hypothetical protein [Xylographa bjoerkii]
MAYALDSIISSIKEQAQLLSTKTNGETIKGWRIKVKEAVSNVTKLSDPLSIAPGISSCIPSSNNYQPPAPSDASSDSAAVDLAIQKLAAELEALDDSKINYETAIEAQTKVLHSMADDSSIEKMGQIDEQYNYVNAVKIVYLNVLAQLKLQSGNLKQFYAALHAMIAVVQTRSSSFEKDITTLKDVGMAAGSLAVNNPAQTIFTSTLLLKAYFALLYDMAAEYARNHNEYILIGHDLYDSLSRQESLAEVIQAQQELEQFADRAASDIARAVRECRSPKIL